MKKQESSVKVYFSTDYGSFKFLKGNRDISERKVKAIILAIEKGETDLLKFCPIIVNSEFVIIDGQHRFAVSMQLKRPVFFIIADQVELLQVATLNSNSSNWKISDFLNSFCDLKKPPYIKVKELCDKYNCNPGVAAGLLHFGAITDAGHDIGRIFKAGNIELNHEEYAHIIIEMCLDYIDLCANPLTRAFVSAICVLEASDKYSHNKITEKAKKTESIIESYTSYKSVLSRIEEIANIKAKKRVILF